MTSETESVSPSQFCTECGRQNAPDALVRFGDRVVCQECKPLFLQKLREGVPAGRVYGGFWIRALAQMIDGLILGIFMLPVILLVAWIVPGKTAGGPNYLFAAVMALAWLVLVAASFIYQAYFLSRKGATLGKMLLGLKVVKPNGEFISFGLAIGRVFAHALSGMILYIGYLMAAFDHQKRALHDHLCGTLVIREG